MATVNFIPCKKQNAFSMRNEIEYILQNFKVCIEPEKFNCDHTVNYQTYSGDADKTGCIRQPRTATKRLTKPCSITTTKPLRTAKPYHPRPHMRLP